MCKLAIIGEGNGTPLQYSCLENPMDGGAWWAAVHGVAKSQIWLSDFSFTFHFPALEKEVATHSSVLAWRIPGTRESGRLPSLGLHRVGHDCSHLAATAWKKQLFRHWDHIRHKMLSLERLGDPWFMSPICTRASLKLSWLTVRTMCTISITLSFFPKASLFKNVPGRTNMPLCAHLLPQKKLYQASSIRVDI